MTFRSTVLSLWTLSRPLGMALIVLLPNIGFAFAFWDYGCIVPIGYALPRLLLLAALWALPHAGTMWLNAALDRDQGEVLFGRPVALPARLELFAYPTLIVSVLISFSISLPVAVCVAGCAALSVLYSHPKSAWKAHAFFGPFCNVVGYGLLSPTGGYALSGLPPTERGALTLLVSACFLGTAYFSAQAFQEDEDRARHYRTWVALRGGPFVVRLTRILHAASAILTLGLSALGFYPRLLLAAAPFFLWTDGFLARWAEQPKGGDAGWATRFFFRLTVSGLACVAMVTIDFAWAVRIGAPLGGLSTYRGHPSIPFCGTAGGD